MRYIMMPNRIFPAYGQDILNALTQRELGLTPVFPSSNGYDIPSDCDILVAHPADPLISDNIKTLRPNVVVISHVHLQWSYLDTDSKANLISTLGRSSMVIVPANLVGGNYSAAFPRLTVE